MTATLREALERIVGINADQPVGAGDGDLCVVQSIAARALADKPVAADKRERIARIVGAVAANGSLSGWAVNKIIAELDQ